MKRRLRRQRGRFRFTSYYQSDSTSAEPARPRRSDGGPPVPRSRRLGLIISGLLLIAVVAGIGLFGISNPIYVEVEGADAELTQEVKAIATTQLQASVLNRLKPLVDERELADSIASGTGSIYDISVQTPAFSRGIIVRGVMRAPMLYMKQDDRTIIFDQTGAAYEDQSADVSSLPRVIDESIVSQGSELSAINLPQTAVQFISHLNRIIVEDKKLADRPITVRLQDAPRTVVWQPDGTRYEVRFISDRDPLDQIEEYEVMERYLRRRSITPESYIDLRIDDTAYYR